MGFRKEYHAGIRAESKFSTIQTNKAIAKMDGAKSIAAFIKDALSVEFDGDGDSFAEQILR